jgi:hypothetical protein
VNSAPKGASRFEWPWPPRMFFKTIPPARGWEFRLGPGRHRAFLVEQDEHFDGIAWGGAALLRRDGAIRNSAAMPFLAALLLYQARHFLKHEYRSPLGGLRALYRAGGTVAGGLLGETSWKAWSKLYPEGSVTKGFQQRDFRRRLAPVLGTPIGELSLHCRLPVGIAAVFRLPKWDNTTDNAVRRIHQNLGERIWNWRRPGGKGRRPKDPLAWIHDLLDHPGRPPIAATREEAVCAVAHATWVAQSICYPYAMAVLVRSVDPPLGREEALLFQWHHGSKSLLGVPLQCLRRDYWDLVQPIALEFLTKRITSREARRRMAQALMTHRSLSDAAAEEDRLRHCKRRVDEELRKQIKERRRDDRGRTVRYGRPSDESDD